MLMKKDRYIDMAAYYAMPVLKRTQSQRGI